MLGNWNDPIVIERLNYMLLFTDENSALFAPILVALRDVGDKNTIDILKYKANIVNSQDVKTEILIIINGLENSYKSTELNFEFNFNQ